MINSHSIAGAVLALLAIVVGFAFQDDPYRLRSGGMPADQVALEHRDSAYSHITWVVSDSSNYMQLRFFDKVEGGICLQPSWGDYANLAASNPRLSHLVMPEDPPQPAEPGRMWPEDRPLPNPGTLPNTRYVCIYPIGVLANEPLMAAAGGDPRKAAPHILIIGMGSGVGPALYAHHFPEAAITVVDIDPTVNEMVLDYYPFLRWLTTQTTSDGSPRLRIVHKDARQYVKYASERADTGETFDLVVLDAYTSGSTIPSHLMTTEFYAELKATFTDPDHSIFLANIIGSYTGDKRYVIGGAMRSLQAAGLEHIMSLPVLYPLEAPPFQGDHARNNMVLASASPIDPARAPEVWKRAQAFVPYQALPEKTYVSELVSVRDPSPGSEYRSSGVQVPLPEGEPISERVRRAARQKHRDNMQQAGADVYYADPDGWYTAHLTGDLLPQLRSALKAERGELPLNWGERTDNTQLVYSYTDWVAFTRSVWRRALAAADERDSRARFVHAGTTIVGEPDARDRALIPDAPEFTDAQPNADVMNR